MPDAVDLVRAAIAQHHYWQGRPPRGIAIVERPVRGVTDVGDGLLRVDRATMDEVALICGEPAGVIEVLCGVRVEDLL